MPKVITKTITTTTETISELVPASSGAEGNSRILSVYSRFNGKERPEIRLVGNWLDGAGFHVGDKIMVETKENELVIRKLVEDK